MDTKFKTFARIRRHRRVRAKVSGTPERPRLVVFKSDRHLFAQLVDDSGSCARTILGARTSREGGTLTQRAAALGALVAQAARERGIERVVFDRGGYPYHGVVKAFAEAAREGGLQF